jgi:hypothetical protein
MRTHRGAYFDPSSFRDKRFDRRSLFTYLLQFIIINIVSLASLVVVGVGPTSIGGIVFSDKTEANPLSRKDVQYEYSHPLSSL